MMSHKFQEKWLEFNLFTRITRGKDLSVAKAIENAIEGLVGEVGEIFDGMKKQEFHPSKKKSEEDFQTYLDLEVGDVLWYLAWMYDLGLITGREPRQDLPEMIPAYIVGARIFSEMVAILQNHAYPAPNELCLLGREYVMIWVHPRKKNIPEKMFRALAELGGDSDPEDYLIKCIHKNMAKLTERHPQAFQANPVGGCRGSLSSSSPMPHTS